MSYVFIALTILLTIYGQLTLKWQVGLNPDSTIAGSNWRGIIMLLLNPWVISAFAAAFGASLCWMAAIGRMPLSKAYPFTSLSFPIVAILSTWAFRETMDWHKIAGTILIIAGVIVVSRSSGA
ncbi:EamA family transporter [Xanthomonas cannabis]|uniref:Drug/metabolite transporter (DMT)-like permease n=1 Tax=Xanthomonas cannabis TaxID=1885674 RepID=A0ABR6JFA2_9XANT|nr:EamA family transporter [Xanthomonas cannabis]MBB4591470.1 drug/metabolite transporter (DMT)-like permease [Xanthomonas cannabis]MBB5521315.1 drug/metabolite transporter (DMT)-like permease [Xanthomonas cannabis]